MSHKLVAGGEAKMNCSRYDEQRPSLPRPLLPGKIKALRDRDLISWYRRLKEVRQRSFDRYYDNPKRIRWCYYEARREMVHRGLKQYAVA